MGAIRKRFLCSLGVLLLVGSLFACSSSPGASFTEFPVSPIPSLTMTIPTSTSTQTPTGMPLPTEIPMPVQIVDDFGVPMVMIPAGEFEMGQQGGDPNESPVHTVILDAFYMDQYEATNGDYLECVRAGICSEQSATEINDPTLANYPMRHISWNEARTYCRWRGTALPTEAQWEKAARGGMVGARYPWGDDEPICEFGFENGAKFDDGAGCHDTGPEPVGSYAPNAYGLYDMAGNLAEWTADWLADDYYSSSPSENPQGPERRDASEFKVVRGGSWHTEATTLQVAHRYGVLPGFAYNLLGFRCVAPASQP